MSDMSIMGAGYANNVTKQELKMDNQVFKNAEKSVKKTEVRNADWGLYAAQNCLSRDLVNANPDEANLIYDKMNFIQGLINDNLGVDSKIYADKTDSHVKKNNSRCEIIKTSSDAFNDTLRTTGDFITNNKNLLIDYVA